MDSHILVVDCEKDQVASTASGACVHAHQGASCASPGAILMRNDVICVYVRSSKNSLTGARSRTRRTAPYMGCSENARHQMLALHASLLVYMRHFDFCSIPTPRLTVVKPGSGKRSPNSTNVLLTCSLRSVNGQRLPSKLEKLLLSKTSNERDKLLRCSCIKLVFCRPQKL